MKKLICFIGIAAILLTMSLSAFAGDVPESLLIEDSAKVFIGRVDGRTTLAETTLPYEENKVLYIDITPIHKYKGDVEIGVSQTYTKHNFGSFVPEKGKEYLFGYLDENNFYIYEIKSRDEKSIKLVDSDKHDMTKRLEDYLNEGAFVMAEQERLTIGKQISFVEYLYQKPSLSSSSVDKVTLRYQDELHEVDKDEFFQVAEDIMITGTKNEMLYETKKDSKTPEPYKTVLYIELLDANDECIYYGAVSRFGEVDRYGLFMSRLMQKDYEMKPEDLSKLYSLLPADVQKSIVTPESLPVSTESLPPEPPAEPVKDYTDWVIGGVAVIFVIALAIWFRIRNKKQK